MSNCIDAARAPLSFEDIQARTSGRFNGSRSLARPKQLTASERRKLAGQPERLRNLNKRPNKFASTGRLTQVRRLFKISALLAESRTGYLSISDITQRLVDETDEPWCDRTVRRDLVALDELGIADQESMSSYRYQWCGHSDAMARAVMQAQRNTKDDDDASSASGMLQMMLTELPPPWNLDTERHEFATIVARLVAMFGTSDRRFMKANLIFILGKGWSLQRPGVDSPSVSAFDRVLPLPQVAANLVDEIDFDNDRWELT